MLRTIGGIPWRQWLRPPANLLVLFLVTTLVFLAGVFYVAWQSVEHAEREEAQTRANALTEAGKLAVAELQRNLAEIDGQLERFFALPDAALSEALSGYSLRLGDDALIVAFEPLSVRAFPRQRLLFYPMLPEADEPNVRSFSTVRPGGQPQPGEDAAVEYFRGMTLAEDAQTRAEGILGLAYAQATLGQPQTALATYALLQQPDVLVQGRPAELLARLARCQLLADLRSKDLPQAVRELDRDLHTGRWQLTRMAYLHYSAQVKALVEKIGGSPADSRPSMTTLALAGGVDFLWKTWQEQGFTAEASTGRMTRVWYGLPTLLMWRATAGRAVAIVASPAFVQQHVVAPLQTVLDSGGVRLRLMDNEGHAVLPGENPPLPSRETVRTIVAPWVVTVVDARPEPDGSQFQTRRQLVIAGCALLTLLVLAATYFGVRATVREFEAVRLKSDFVAAVSHEFRTPLTLLRQFSDLLADNRVSSEAERHLYYAALQRGTRRLTRLVEDLLDFGRMEAGSRAFKVEPIRAKAWMESLIGEFQEETRSKGYVVELSWTAPIEALVRVDAEAMSRAVWNLLDNAVKYSPTEKTIWVTGAADESQLRISVRDRGVGIPPNEQRLIFRKFVRGSQPPGHTIKGTGLGLALVEQIVRAHGGGVHVESVGGEGSTFTISLPLDTALRAHVGLDAATPETIGQTPPMFAGASSDVRTSKPSA